MAAVCHICAPEFLRRKDQTQLKKSEISYEAFNRIHNGQTDTCLEEEGRERFITYVSGIINGTGTYHVEEQLRDDRQADLVIHYLGRRYVIQLKTGHGERYHSEDEKQLTGCLDDRNLNTGYLLRFNLNKEKASGVRRIHLSDKVLYDGTV